VGSRQAAQRGHELDHRVEVMARHLHLLHVITSSGGKKHRARTERQMRTSRATRWRLRHTATISAATAARGLSSLPNQACLKALRLICSGGEGAGSSQMPLDCLHSGRHSYARH
jgi:hypothetical protein